MPSEKEWFFAVLDGHTRIRYLCFVAELFLNDDQTSYFVCFRPTNAVQYLADRYACKYLQIEVAQVRAARREQRLTDSILERLEHELGGWLSTTGEGS